MDLDGPVDDLPTTVRGTITLAAAIRCRAALLPSLSTAYAARWQSARAASSSIRLSAIRSRTADCSASVLPNAVRDLERSTISCERPLAGAERAHHVVDAARAEPGLGVGEAAALLAEQVGQRDADVVELDQAVAVVVVAAEDRVVAHDLDARGVASGR